MCACKHANVQTKYVPHIAFEQVQMQAVGSNTFRISNKHFPVQCISLLFFLHIQVVCRNLGFDAATEALSNGYFGPGQSSQPIWLDNVQCYGSEYNLTSCLNTQFQDYTGHCQHYEDAGVRCHGESIHYAVFVATGVSITQEYRETIIYYYACIL